MVRGYPGEYTETHTTTEEGKGNGIKRNKTKPQKMAVGKEGNRNPLHPKKKETAITNEKG